jgi:hypothetical protein
MAEAAQTFLDLLEPGQREVAVWPFPGDEERRLFSYAPTDHGGLPLSAMRPAVQQAALRLLSTGLSRAGYGVACTIISLDNIGDEAAGWMHSHNGRERHRDPGLYYMRVFGDPGGDGPWSWRFAGHHLSVHHTVAGGVVRPTPIFMGANPAWSPLLGGDALRPLASAEDIGRALVVSLSDEQRALAILSSIAPADIVTGNRSRIAGGELPVQLSALFREPIDLPTRSNGLDAEQTESIRLSLDPKGLPASELTPSQEQLLRRLMGVYFGRVADEVAATETARFAGGGLHQVRFAWAGGLEAGDLHYYRIQGPRLLIEYDNAQDAANHIHSVWRDPEGDFGEDVLRQHLAEAH